MRKLTWIMLAPAALLVAACGRKGAPAIDDALKNDLALASQAQIGSPSSISPTEAGYAPQQKSYAPRATQAASRSSSSRRTSSAARSSGSRSSASTGGYYPAPAPAPTTETVEKHTTRDAAIGAAAGAVIGATTSRDKVKGGLIGAAAGGIVGAVIGNNVDIKKRVGW
ncbi:MAG: YMGG-like glycine zipper-containing protein [Gemmatimonadaceae bacterium]